MASYAVDKHGYQLQSRDILPYFGLKPNSPIPPLMNSEVEIQGFRYKILPKVSDRRKHRVFAQCSLCKQDIPAGRIQQHIGKPTCKAVS